VVRIEQSALGTVFVCTFGGTKHGVSGCHRTYLSQRDLQSHIAHRHFGAGRDTLPPRPIQSSGAPAPVPPPSPAGASVTMSFSSSQHQQPGATTMTHDTSAGLIYRTMQHPQPQGPNAGHGHLVITHPPPSLSQPPPQMNQPPPQHLISSHSSTHLMNAPPSGPPGMMQGSHVMQQHGIPPSGMIVQSMPPSASRGTNLITVQLHEEGDFRVDSGQNSAGSGVGRVQLATTQTDNSMSHYPPPMQQYPPPGSLVQSYAVSEHHQMITNVRPMMTHPPPLGPGQAQLGPGQTQLGPGQVMVTYSLPHSQMGPPPTGPPQRLGPPPQLQPQMQSQGMHSGPPPPQGMMSNGPPPPQGMIQTGPPPQGMPPPQGLRAGPPPQGYAAPHHQDQRPQFVGGQQIQWTTGPPLATGPPQMQHLGQRPPQGNIGSSQSMPYYQ